MNKWTLTEIIPPINMHIGEYIISIASTYMLDDGKTKILIDPGAQIISPILLGKLNELRVDKKDIDYIIVTHMHADHYYNIVFFPEAQLIVNKKCVDDWRKRMATMLGEKRASSLENLILGERKVIFIEEEKLEFFNGLEIISVNLHQPGHLIVLVETDRGCEAITGDALLLPIWDVIRILTGEIVVKIPELVSLLNMLMEKCSKIHQGHFSAIDVRKVKKFINAMKS